MQRIGRRGHAQFRVVVQDSRQSPKSGKFVALLGSYDPHTKTTSLVKDKAQTYLDHGAQPSDRVALLFKSEGVKLPKWVTVPDKKSGKIKNQEKLRKNRSEEAPEPAAKAEEAAEATTAEAEPVSEQKEAEAPTDSEASTESSSTDELTEPTDAVKAVESPADESVSEESATEAPEPETDKPAKE